MELTFEELKEKLAEQLDPDDLLDLLDLSSEEIIEGCDYKLLDEKIRMKAVAFLGE